MLLRNQTHFLCPPSLLRLLVDRLKKNPDSVNNFCILEIFRSVDNYFAKIAASCVIKPFPNGKSKNHPTPTPTKHPWNNHFDRRNLLRVGFDVSAVTVRATSDINVINRRCGVVFCFDRHSAVKSRGKGGYLRGACISQRWGQTRLIRTFLF